VRNLGRMGESVFSQWCASVGLTANPSNVDETGWDFFVEFGFDLAPNQDFSVIHEAAFECKVQVKSTDKKLRKLPIKLSNLKRLATAPSPAFFVFLEFDGKASPQRSFLVHFDQVLCTKVLARLNDVEHKGGKNLLHKKSMTVSYRAEDMLSDLSGTSLAAAMQKHIGPSMSQYVAHKNSYLRSVGYEDGIAELTLSTDGVENMSALIDMSIGLASHVKISNLVGFKKRFGKKSAVPYLKESNVKLEMPDLKPSFEGTAKFKGDKLGSAFSFAAKLYVSPFESWVPESLRRSRIAGEFFDIVFNTFENSCSVTFLFRDKEFEINLMKRSLELRKMVSARGQKIYLEFIVAGFPSLKFELTSPGMPFEFQNCLAAVEAGMRVMSLLAISDFVEISLEQAARWESRLIEMESVLSPESKTFKITIPKMALLLPSDKEAACISFFSTPLGNLWVGAFVTIIGKLYPDGEGGYNLYSTTRVIERTVVKERTEKISRGDLVEAVVQIEKKYEAEYTVLTRFDKEQL
jgi:hypothetical protein